MSQRKNILFIFHETNHTGASLVLFRYIKSLPRENYFLLFYVKKEGPLCAELEKIGTVFYDKEYYLFPNRSVFQKFFFKLTGKKVQNQLILALKKIPLNLIVANTLGSSNIIVNLKKELNTPVAWYIHELKLAAEVAAFQKEEAAKLVSFWIVNSEATRLFVQDYFKLREAHIYVVPPQIVIPANMEKYLPFPNWKKDFVVGSSGSVISRKGYELFIQLAFAIKKLNSTTSFRFIWVGAFNSNKAEIEQTLEKFDLTNTVQFVGESDEPFKYYKYFDIFVSTSKEESFGLACLESAYLGKPVLGFAGTGGLEEVIKGCQGKLIPFMDVNTLASTIVELAENAVEIEKMKNSSIKYANTFKETTLSPIWATTIQSILKSAATS